MTAWLLVALVGALVANSLAVNPWSPDLIRRLKAEEKASFSKRVAQVHPMDWAFHPIGLKRSDLVHPADAFFRMAKKGGETGHPADRFFRLGKRGGYEDVGESEGFYRLGKGQTSRLHPADEAFMMFGRRRR